MKYSVMCKDSKLISGVSSWTILDLILSRVKTHRGGFRRLCWRRGGREGAVQVHREGKLLHEYKSKERKGGAGAGGMALALRSASRLISTKNIAKSSLLSSST